MVFEIVDSAFAFVTVVSKETNNEEDEDNDDEGEDGNEESDKDEGQFEDVNNGSQPKPYGLSGNVRDSGIESLGLVDDCSDRGNDPSQLLSALSTLSSTPSHVAPHLHSTLSTLLAPSLAAPSAPLIAPSTPFHMACSCFNSPTAHTTHSPLGSVTSDRGCGRGRGRGHGRGIIADLILAYLLLLPFLSNRPSFLG